MYGKNKDTIAQIIKAEQIGKDEQENLVSGEYEYIVDLNTNSKPRQTFKHMLSSPKGLILIVSTAPRTMDLSFNGYSRDMKPVQCRTTVTLSIEKDNCARATSLFEDFPHFNHNVVLHDNTFMEIDTEAMMSILKSNLVPVISDVISRYSLEQVMEHELDKDGNPQRNVVESVINSELQSNTSYYRKYGMAVKASGISVINEKSYLDALKVGPDGNVEIGELLSGIRANIIATGKTPEELKEETEQDASVAEGLIRSKHALELLQINNAMEKKRLEDEGEIQEAEKKNKLDALEVDAKLYRMQIDALEIDLDNRRKTNEIDRNYLEARYDLELQNKKRLDELNLEHTAEMNRLEEKDKETDIEIKLADSKRKDRQQDMNFVGGVNKPSGDSSTAPESNNGKWKCKCGFLNKPENTVCLRCHKER